MICLEIDVSARSVVGGDRLKLMIEKVQICV